MVESQTQCTDCGATILQRTADRHDGRCVRCHRKATEQYLRSPRLHHYAFAHKHLPASLWQDPSILLHALFIASAQFREDQLHIRWKVVAERFEPAERLGDEGLCCSIHALKNGFQAAVITLPPARGPAEAHMVAIVYRPSKRHLWFWKTEPILRYLTLELGFDPETNECLTMLCEWTPQGHLNYDKGPAPNVPGFLEAIQRLMTAQEDKSKVNR